MRRLAREVPHLVIERVKRANWKKIGTFSGSGVVVALILVQLFYPANRMLPFATIDGVAVAGQPKAEVIKQLNSAYSKQKVAIYLGSSTEPVISPSLKDIDGSIDNAKRVNDATYPWYMRLIPTSLFWAGRSVAPVPVPVFGDKFSEYVTKNIMPDCEHDPVNATLKVNGDALEVVPGSMGGTCQAKDVVSNLKAIKPVLNSATKVHVERIEKAPNVTDATATALAKTLRTRLTKGITLQVLDETMNVEQKVALSWLDFTADGTKLVAKLNGDRVGDWLSKNVASKVHIAPGVSYVTTYNFTETARKNGANGRNVNVAATVSSLQSVIDGAETSASVALQPVPPTTQYTRTYSASDTGLSALMTNYAKDHAGTFGASMIELGGKGRRASYNGDKQFVTASTYKLFVAYSLLKQIDEGKRSWESSSDCFNKMISLSDNACAKSFLNSIGVAKVTSDIQAVGLKNSTFMKPDNIYSTPDDLALMLGMIATGQNFSSSNQQRLIAAMKANVYRQGIPAGVQGTVADKVGFMWGLLHDAAIVYGPHGTYVLAIMTDGSTWGGIADLARQIDQLHAQ